MKKNKIKVLFLPLGIGLAHTGRSIMIAKELRKRGHDVVFGIGRECHDIVAREKFRYAIVPELPNSAVNKARKLNTSFYSVKIIEKFIKAELELYKKEKPDIVISDTRTTAKLSTKIANIPLITINNANVTKYYDFSNASFPFPSFFLSQYINPKYLSLFEKPWVNKKILSKLAPYIAEIMLFNELLKFNKVALKFGQKPITSFYHLALGDLTLLLDVDFYRPTKKLPNNVVLVGPIFWQPNVALPAWAKQIIKEVNNNKTILYLTAGGTGEAKIFRKIAKYLSNYPAITVATVGNAFNLKSLKLKNFFITKYLPGNWIMQLSSALVFFGGNSTAYQSINFGIPQLIFPLHIDQVDNANQMKRLGTCRTINPYNFSQKELFAELSTLLNDPSYKKASLKWKKRMTAQNGTIKAADEVEKFFNMVNT